MTAASVLFFSCEPGGAEVLIPVVKLLAGREDLRVAVVSYGLGAQRFAAQGIDFVEIGPVARGDLALLDRFIPDLVITSATSLPDRDMSDRHLWLSARERGIPTLAFLDQWQNYALRFSGPDGRDLLGYLPDFINCIDGIGEKEMVAAGFDPARLVRLGHPYLSELGAESILPDEVAKAREAMGTSPSQPIALFVSEPIREHFGTARGYDQYDALALFLELVARSEERPRPVVKLHPKDTPEAYRALLERFRREAVSSPSPRPSPIEGEGGHGSMRIASGRGCEAGRAAIEGEGGASAPVVVGSELAPSACIAAADAVYGMSSVMLIEAYLTGKPVLSLQPGLRVEDPLVLSRHGLIPRVYGSDGESLLSQTSPTLPPPLQGEGRGEDGVPRLQVHFDPDRFLTFITSLLPAPQGPKRTD